MTTVCMGKRVTGISDQQNSMKNNHSNKIETFTASCRLPHVAHEYRFPSVKVSGSCRRSSMVSSDIGRGLQSPSKSPSE